MGLEMVDIAMSIEERFGVSILDEDVVPIRSVGHLYDYVMEKRFGRSVPDCPVQAAFYRLRRAMVSMLSVDRKSVRPSTPIVELIPRRSRRRTWKLLQGELSLDLPPLTQPDAVIAGVFLVVCACVAAGALLLAITTDWWAVIGLGGLLVALLALVGYGLSVRLATLPWSDYQTVGGLAKGVVSYNYEAFSGPGPSTDQGAEVWEAVCEIVSNAVGVKREKVHRASRFFEDLGAG